MSLLFVLSNKSVVSNTHIYEVGLLGIPISENSSRILANRFMVS